MAAPFVSDLLGFVGNKPNTADGSSEQSRAISGSILEILGVDHQAPGGQSAGRALEVGVQQLLAQELPVLDPSHAWIVGCGGKISAFRQYAHLAQIDDLIRADPALRVELGVDYLISPDVTVCFPHGHTPALPILHAAISCKFSIRSDRVQNIRHESIAMIRHRRGRQPHIVTVTSEPLPTRLAAICRGTGEVDAVYHACLTELQQAVADVGNVDQQGLLEEVVGQGRLYDLTDLPGHLTI